MRSEEAMTPLVCSARTRRPTRPGSVARTRTPFPCAPSRGGDGRGQGADRRACRSAYGGPSSPPCVRSPTDLGAEPGPRSVRRDGPDATRLADRVVEGATIERMPEAVAAGDRAVGPFRDACLANEAPVRRQAFADVLDRVGVV